MNNIYCQDIFYGKRLLTESIALEGLESCNANPNVLITPSVNQRFYNYNIYFSRNYALDSDTLATRLTTATSLACFKTLIQ